MLDDFDLYVGYRISDFRPNWLCFRLRLGKAQPVTETCQICGGPLGFLFSGTYCKNQHCDLPADKKAAAKKKDEEIRASTKPNPTPGSVATPVSTPVQAICRGLCGKPPNYVNDGLGGYYCDNQCTIFGTRGVCGAKKPIDFATLGKSTSTAANSWNFQYPTFTINWGGQPIDVISDPDIQRNWLVPGPEVRADSSPPGKDWRDYRAASRCSSYDGYADWYEAGNREELEHYNR